MSQEGPQADIRRGLKHSPPTQNRALLDLPTELGGPEMLATKNGRRKGGRWYNTSPAGRYRRPAMPPAAAELTQFDLQRHQLALRIVEDERHVGVFIGHLTHPTGHGCEPASGGRSQRSEQ
jgi:hypothetical protein